MGRAALRAIGTSKYYTRTIHSPFFGALQVGTYWSFVRSRLNASYFKACKQVSRGLGQAFHGQFGLEQEVMGSLSLHWG